LELEFGATFAGRDQLEAIGAKAGEAPTGAFRRH
jgi:hypothetical protein